MSSLAGVQSTSSQLHDGEMTIMSGVVENFDKHNLQSDHIPTQSRCWCGTYQWRIISHDYEPSEIEAANLRQTTHDF